MSTPIPSTADWVRWLARPVGRAERERAALHVLDWLACASAGSRTDPGLAMGRFARTLAPGACATFAGPALAEGDAALVNAALGKCAGDGRLLPHRHCSPRPRVGARGFGHGPGHAGQRGADARRFGQRL